MVRVTLGVVLKFLEEQVAGSEVEADVRDVARALWESLYGIGGCVHLSDRTTVTKCNT